MDGGREGIVPIALLWRGSDALVSQKCHFIRPVIAGCREVRQRRERHLKKPHRFVWSSPPTKPRQ
eukprot:5050913-Amphidinium_carterae.1